MKTVKITPPQGYTVDKENSTFENIVFKLSGDIRDRIQTIEDVFTLNNTTEEEFENKWRCFSNYEKGNALEALIVNAYNEDKKPVWDDGSYKYIPCFDMRENSFSFNYFDSWNYRCNTSARFVFLSKENMLDAVKKFLKEYKLSRLGK